MTKIIKYQFTLIQLLITNYLQKLDYVKFHQKSRFKYPIHFIHKINQQFIVRSTLFIFSVKYPLIVNNSNFSHEQTDQKLKQLYQFHVMSKNLKNDFQFQYFMLILVKLFAEFFVSNFPNIEFGYLDQCQIYCLLIKSLIGIFTIPKTYSIIEKRYIDFEIDFQQNIPKIQLKQIHLQESHSETKRFITLNSIETKLLEKKIKRRNKAMERFSLKVRESKRMNEIDDFKQNLKKQLSIKRQEKHLKQKLNHSQLEMMDAEKSFELRRQIKQISNLMQKQNLDTQQISASLQLSLMLKNIPYHFTKSNITLKKTNKNERFSHSIFEIATKSQKDEVSQLQKSLKKFKDLPNIRGSINIEDRSNSINKSKTYWNKMCKLLKKHKENIKN